MSGPIHPVDALKDLGLPIDAEAERQLRAYCDQPQPRTSDMSLEIEKVLLVSTGHIPKHTAEALGELKDFDLGIEPKLWDHLSYVLWHEYGWIIWASSDAEGTMRDVGHPELGALLKLAYDHGCSMLRLDCDVDTLPEELGFPIFNWEA